MIQIDEINFQKLGGLIPACIQHVDSSEVLMVGFMNRDALQKSIELNLVTFWSRTRNTLWTKGETSGNFLHIKSMTLDCDNDSILIEVAPSGNTCHKGTASCFSRETQLGSRWYSILDERLESRFKHPKPESYTSNLIKQGGKRIAQKVGEEGLEVALATISGSKDDIASECADLLFHCLVLLKYKEISPAKVTEVLKMRFKLD